MRPHQAYSVPVTGLAGGDARYSDDRGEADLAVAAALDAYAAGAGAERAVLTALAVSRLLVPVVAVLADTGVAETESAETGSAKTYGADPRQAAPGRERASEMAIPSLVGQDGRLAMVAFTCSDSVRRWRPAARPVPVPATAVFQAAVAEASAVVIDVAGPVALTIEGTRLAVLAAGGEVPDMYQDPDVWDLVAAAAGSVAPGIRVRLTPPPAGAAFTLELAPPPGRAGEIGAEVAAEVADAVYARLAGRVRSGIAVLRRPG
jgi:SseB protein N-terminal domain